MSNSRADWLIKKCSCAGAPLSLYDANFIASLDPNNVSGDDLTRLERIAATAHVVTKRGSVEE
jgi:hypothetical protein